MTKKKILFIDDDVGFTRTVKVSLEEFGTYVVRTENSAMEALAAARQFKPDIIFLDVLMPGMDGGDVDALFEQDYVVKHTPVVFLTAIVSRKETGETVAVKGGKKFMAKPVTLDELVKCIEENTSSKKKVLSATSSVPESTPFA